jgi:Flp pilus assembly protein TadG
VIRHIFPALAASRSGTAAIEFALITPVLLAILGGMADFGLAFCDQSKLAVAVSAGAQYAFSQGQASQTATSSDVQSKVQNALALAGSSVAVTPPALYCVSRGTSSTPPSSSISAGTVGQNCADGNLPGTYMTITATYAYSPLLPFYSQITNTTLRQAATVRLF